THATSSTTTAASVIVNKRATTTTVTCTSPVFVNQGSNCNATVTDVSPAPVSTPTGSVTFTVSGVTGTFTTCTLAAGTTAGTATCTVTFSSTSTGTAAISATYTSADTAHSGSSTTSPFSVSVGGHPTSTSITCTSPVFVNQGSTCTATVTDTSAT